MSAITLEQQVLEVSACEDKQVGAPNRKLRAICALLILSLAYGVAEFVPGRVTQTDEVFFKAAGRNWAMTGHFAAPEIVGRLNQGPPLTEIYFAQPPVYTFVYGVYTRLVGFNPRSSILYDILLHLLLVWSAVAVARVVFELPWGLSALCGALLIPLGTVGRPDELGILLAFWAAVAFRSRIRHRAAVGGALLGVCVATSLGAATFLGSLMLWELVSSERNLGARIRGIVTVAIMAVLAAFACAAPILITHPTAYIQLIAHAGEQTPVLSMVTGVPDNPGGRVHGFLHSWSAGLRTAPSNGLLVAGLVLFCVFLRWFDKNAAWTNYSRVALAALVLSCLVVVMQGKFFYLWFVAAWSLIAAIALGSKLFPSISPGRRRLLVTMGICFWVAASIPYLFRKAVLWSLPYEQSLTASTQRIRTEVPPNVGVVTTEFWWALADRDRVYDVQFSNPKVGAVDYVVVSGNGGAPGLPVGRRGYKDGHFEVSADHLRQTPESILGFRLARVYGFGEYVLKKSADHQK